MKRPHKTPASRPARLFAEPERPAGHAEGAHVAHIDGAARGNPGPAAYGVILRRPDGRPLEELKKYVGRTTNNVAEYYALIAALDCAAAHGVRKLLVRSDSELLVRQMQGCYKVKSPDLHPLHERARKLAQSLEYFAIEHVPREQNRKADALANEALDHTGGRHATHAEEHETRKSIPKLRDEIRPEKQRVRARYRGGALHPAEPLDLAEGEEVELTIYKPRL